MVVPQSAYIPALREVYAKVMQNQESHPDWSAKKHIEHLAETTGWNLKSIVLHRYSSLETLIRDWLFVLDFYLPAN